MKKFKPYIIFILLTLCAGGIGWLVSSGGMQEYELAVKPVLTPPSAVFPIVWTILFILMGISAAMVWVVSPENRRKTVTIYVAQLAANIIWSVIFFGFHAYLLSFIWLIVLWILILEMILVFYKASPKAAFLQIPYLIWVTFAGYLNLMIWLLNR